ncbi:hypothetical protein ARMGADRAFT_1037299 [Armillaria gallica]|uniref:Uncharacterized protein n=1 Tax=Armillaria gallica TaxID=47427 RepID=A0A2H3CRX5_ARMGA|nr:hypothetical protein ARMGADRAFT_1037299 [Armillaria gallica]
MAVRYPYRRRRGFKTDHTARYTDSSVTVWDQVFTAVYPHIDTFLKQNLLLWPSNWYLNIVKARKLMNMTTGLGAWLEIVADMPRSESKFARCLSVYIQEDAIVLQNKALWGKHCMFRFTLTQVIPFLAQLLSQLR